MDRVALCLIDPKVTRMSAKYVLGDDVESWKGDFEFPVKSDQDNLFAHCLHSRQTVWLRKNKTSSVGHLVNKKIQRLVQVENLLVGAIYANNRPIGLLVADKGRKGPQITQEQFESFEYFCQQTCTSLAMLAAKRKQAASRH